MLVTQTTFMRTVLDIMHRKPIWCFHNGSEFIQMSVMLRPRPYLDLPRSVFWTGLNNVYVIILDNLLGLDGFHTLWTQCGSLTNLFGHVDRTDNTFLNNKLYYR